LRIGMLGRLPMATLLRPHAGVTSPVGDDSDVIPAL
jgi:hypothetical protein